jgi:hypothetical protein
MKGQELIINFEGDKAYLTEGHALTFKQFNFDDPEIRFKSPAAWTIRVLDYIPEQKKIYAEILSYDYGRQSFPTHQLALKESLSSIEKVSFRGIDTRGLYLTLKGNAGQGTIFPSKDKAPDRENQKDTEYKEYIEKWARKKDYPPIQTNDTPQNQTNDSHTIPVDDNSIYVEHVPETKTIKGRFSFPIKKILFKSGFVSFDARIEQLNRTIGFTIYNSYIREEFDAVKNYFANVLQTKNIQVDAVINVIDGERITTEATSTEISSIDYKTIENVRFEIVKSPPKKRIHDDAEKSIFTLDEFFESLTEEKIKANIFYENEDQLFEDLLKITNTKHYKPLRYLSSKHAHTKMKLRFVIKPVSFIFLIEGEGNYYIIWETIDTEEATYIWHEVADLKMLNQNVQRILNKISEIVAQGKTDYINKKEDGFIRIYHDYSDPVNGFLKWKEEIESALT